MKKTAYLFGTILMIANLFVAAISECTIDKITIYNLYSQNMEFTMNCRNLSLTEVPNSYPNPNFDPNEKVCAIDLSLNSFSDLKNGTFLNVSNLNTSTIRMLNLSFSNISYISTEAFHGLKYLQYLNLSGNSLSCPDGFGKGVFEYIINLTYLNIKENNFETFDCLGRELGYLRNLEVLEAELCENCTFGKDFENLQNLKNVSLSGRTPDTYNTKVLHNYTFEGLTMVKGLWLSSCNISEIEANAFRPMNNSLTHLDISYNEKLGFDGMNKALYGLKFSSALSVLNVNRIHDVHGLGVKLKASNLENLSTLNTLIKLFMDLNKIEIFEKEVFDPRSKFPTSLRVLTLAGNRISFGEYIYSIQAATNITCLDISRQHFYYDPFINEHYGRKVRNEESVNVDDICFKKSKSFQVYSFPENCSLILPPNLLRLKWRKSILNFDLDYNVFICGATNLHTLDLSFNLFTKWKCSIKGLEHLKHLDLSENYCHEISPGFFDHFTELQYLNVSGNYLGQTLAKTLTNRPNGIFRNLTQLTDLDLSHNEIVGFSDRGFFKGLTNIRYLDLNSNRLVNWDYYMPESLKLIIDLSQNKLTNVSSEVREHFDKVCQNSTCNITLILLNNSFQCDCDNLPFLKWIFSTKVNVKIDTCVLKSEEKSISNSSDLKKLFDYLEKDKCSRKTNQDNTWITWTTGTVGVVFGSLSSIMASLGVYKHRWKLRYLYYRRNRRFNHEGFERLFENDAFVSYAKSNASFIKRYMVPSLEKECGLRLWVADRDSMPGTSIAENITHGISMSRKTVLLIDKAYLKDSWCNYEMNMAHVESTETKRKMIIFVLMEDIPLEKLPICIMRFLQSERSLEYPEHGQDLDVFWNDLADQIMN
jgi:Leucine-rich repeat (LRR) protein